jgi:hypothetical protein
MRPVRDWRLRPDDPRPRLVIAGFALTAHACGL